MPRRKKKININEKIANAKYGMIKIDVNNANRGNRLIEYSVRTTLGLPEPLTSISMFHKPSDIGLEQLNKMDFVLIPGSTVLANEKNQGFVMNFLDKIKVPKFCVAASGWSPHFPYNEFAIKNIDGPIGARDPHTVAACSKLGKENIFVGCPTAYVEKVVSNNPGEPFNVIGFARKELEWQHQFFLNMKKLCNNKKLVASIQEREFERKLLPGLTSHAFYYDKPEDVFSHYAMADNVFTGRLHSVLPAMSQSKPVVFFGNNQDSRFSLLSYLGIPIHVLGKSLDFTITYCKDYVDKVNELKANYMEWRKQTIEKIYK